MDEKVILERILNGEKQLFSSIVTENQEMVFRTCMGFVHSKEDADDLTQQVFIKVYESLSSFRGGSSLSTWIYRIAVNTSLNYLRKKNNRSLFSRLENLLSVPASAMHTATPEDRIINAEENAFVGKLIDSLPDKQKSAFVLSKYNDLPQKQVAEIMGITEGAVESLLQRAKANLKKKLQRQ